MKPREKIIYATNPSEKNLERDFFMMDNLNKFYDPMELFFLDSLQTIDTIIHLQDYKALITHLPFKKLSEVIDLEHKAAFYNEFYSPAISALEKIRKGNQRIKIIAYSGIDDCKETKELFSKENGIVDALVIKTQDFKKDFSRLKEEIDG
ncbi:MAG: hypothetical protein ACP5OG_00415 [Candidatus Nanoarchaeia archaeon]